MTELTTQMLQRLPMLFPPEYVRAALVLALMSVWVVIALFHYLDRHSRKTYFRLWTVAWMFYSVYLAASIGLQESPSVPWLIMARRACIGISGLFMFWGSFHLVNRPRNLRELGGGVLFIVVWSLVAAYRVGERLWITMPVFALLAAAGVYTAWLYRRQQRRSRGSAILSLGFGLWGLHLLAFPFLAESVTLEVTAYLVSALLAGWIAVGMAVEHQIKLSEQNYRALFDAAGDAMLLVEFDTLRILEANPSARRLTGRADAELVGQSLAELFPELRDDATSPTGHGEMRRELRLERPDGQARIYEASANLIVGPDGPQLLIVARDITERKQAEQCLRETAARLEAANAQLRQAQQQLIQQERLSALERMASGVAHDFNNALAKILGFSELLLAWPEQLTDRDRVKKHLQMITCAAQDAVKIVNRLREFYRHRKDTDVYQPVDLNQLVEQAVVLTQPKWKDQVMAGGATVWIETSLAELPAVRGNPSELREVLIGLIFNAVDALPRGGTITIRTAFDGECVCLEVRDTGTGMTDEVRQRCLEPFFTTKGEGATGLGLAIVHGIVRRHGGTIAIESELGAGTTFRIRLPAQAAERARNARRGELPHRPLRVLVVEDEPAVRDIEAGYLRGDGHVVETAANGSEGLAKFSNGHFDLVVADRAMPVVNGEQMVAAMKSARAETPVIMVTGFSDLPFDRVGPSARPDVILPKPITHAALRQAVNQLLNRSR